MKYDFDNPVDRRGTNSVKWNRKAIANICGNPDAEPFWVADMDFKSDGNITRVAGRIAGEGVFGYPVFDDLEKTAASWLEKKHLWDVDPEDIVFVNGLLHGIALAINLFTKEGDTILVPSPTYRPFRQLCIDNKRIMLDYPLSYKDGSYGLDGKRFAKEAEKARMILFCSPHNPSGLVFSQEELGLVLKTAKSLGIPVLSDEIHADLVHPGTLHIPMGKANRNIGADVITFMAPSKTFNVAGEHSGIAIFSDKGMEDAFKAFQKGLYVTEPGYLIGSLTETVYSTGLDYNLELCAYLKGNADAIRAHIEKNMPGIRMVDAKASFVTFLDCSGIYEKVVAEVDGHPERYPAAPGGGYLSRFFGSAASVCMNDGTWFGDQYKEFVRFNYGTSRKKVLEALDRMAKAVGRLR